MNRDAMNTWVGAALELVPKGKGVQNEFRMVLAAMLKNALGPSPENPAWTVADVVAVAASRLHGRPRYDPSLVRLAWPERR
jgi:hypothetical protein